MGESVKYVTELRNRGYRFSLITSIGNSRSTYVCRASNLQYYFGHFYDDLICLEMGSSKFKTLEEWKNSGNFWIEDHPENAEAGLQLGLKPILVEHDYNSDHHGSDKFYTVGLDNAWEDIYNYILQEHNEHVV